MRLSYCPLENTPIMLLAPRERVVRHPYSDTWTKLHTRINTATYDRFNLQHVVEKLMVSFETYKVSRPGYCVCNLRPKSSVFFSYRQFYFEGCDIGCIFFPVACFLIHTYLVTSDNSFFFVNY